MPEAGISLRGCPRTISPNSVPDVLSVSGFRRRASSISPTSVLHRSSWRVFSLCSSRLLVQLPDYSLPASPGCSRQSAQTICVSLVAWLKVKLGTTKSTMKSPQWHVVSARSWCTVRIPSHQALSSASIAGAPQSCESCSPENITFLQ